MRMRATRTSTAACACIAMLATWLALPPVHAQSDDALELARLAVHEGGWDATSEPAAIYAVAIDGASRTGMTWPRWLRVHSSRFAHRTIARSWIFRLDRGGRDPRAGIAWASHRDRWLAILAAADAAIGAPPVCVARTWGNDVDAARVRRLGLALVPTDCGRTVNIFFRRGRP